VFSSQTGSSDNVAMCFVSPSTSSLARVSLFVEWSLPPSLPNPTSYPYGIPYLYRGLNPTPEVPLVGWIPAQSNSLCGTSSAVNCSCGTTGYGGWSVAGAAALRRGEVASIRVPLPSNCSNVSTAFLWLQLLPPSGQTLLDVFNVQPYNVTFTATAASPTSVTVTFAPRHLGTLGLCLVGLSQQLSCDNLTIGLGLPSPGVSIVRSAYGVLPADADAGWDAPQEATVSTTAGRSKGGAVVVDWRDGSGALLGTSYNASAARTPQGSELPGLALKLTFLRPLLPLDTAPWTSTSASTAPPACAITGLNYTCTRAGWYSLTAHVSATGEQIGGGLAGPASTELQVLPGRPSPANFTMDGPPALQAGMCGDYSVRLRDAFGDRKSVV
jgi:hypothetical protein